MRNGKLSKAEARSRAMCFEDTCYHEAGHALVARIMPKPLGIRSIIIFDPGKPEDVNGHLSRGATRTYKRYTRPIFHLVAMLYAGSRAEWRLRKRYHSKRNGGFAVKGSDRSEIARLLKPFPERSRRACRRDGMRYADNILRDGWPGVQNLAEHLMRHKRIDGTRAIESIINRRRPRHGRKTTKH